MSIKITHTLDQHTHKQIPYFKPQQHSHYEDAVMMTPQTKRYHKHSPYAHDSTAHSEGTALTNEIYLPSEIDKLKMLFPLLDHQQIEEVVKDSDSSPNKAYSKLVLESRKTEQKGCKGLSTSTKLSSSDPINYDQNFSSVRPSKKRRRDEFESDHSHFPSNDGKSAQVSLRGQAAQVDQQNQGISANASHQNVQIASGQQQAKNEIQDFNERNYAENAVKQLLQVSGPDEAVKLLTDVLKSFKQDVITTHKTDLDKKYSILTRGIAVQNKRIEELVKKIQESSTLAQQFDALHKDYEQVMDEKQSLEEERNMLRRQQGIFYRTNIPTSYSFNSQMHFGGGDNYTM